MSVCVCVGKVGYFCAGFLDVFLESEGKFGVYQCFLGFFCLTNWGYLESWINSEERKWCVFRKNGLVCPWRLGGG